MNVLERIKKVVAEEPNETQLDKYLGEVRESLASSNKHFINYMALIITALVTYQLVVYERSSGVSLNSIQVNPTLFRRTFLVFPAALLAAMASVGYLRRCQREVYDYLTLSRYRVLGQTGLHELRLPADYILGLFVLKNEGGLIGRVLGNLIAFFSLVLFSIAPVGYIVAHALGNIASYGISDILCLATSCVAIALSISSLFIVGLAMAVKAE